MMGIAFFQTVLGSLLPFLPLIAFFEIFLLFWNRSHGHKKNDPDWREAFLSAAAIWAIATFALTELLSFSSALNSLYLAICWGGGRSRSDFTEAENPVTTARRDRNWGCGTLGRSSCW